MEAVPAPETFCKVHPIKCHRRNKGGSTGIAMLILNFGARWRWVINATLRLV
jgi:hypothetical protein